MTIVEFAQGLFARFGFEKTSMDDVARAARVDRTTLYRHFNGKEELFAEVLRNEYAAFRLAVRSTVDKLADPPAKLRAFFHARMFGLKELASLRHVADEPLLELVPVAAEARRHFASEVRLLESLLAEGRSAGVFEVDRPREVALTVLRAMSEIDRLFMRMRDTRELARGTGEMIELLLEALKPSASHQPAAISWTCLEYPT